MRAQVDLRQMSALFSPLTIREVTLRNRIGVSPMCMYSATDGYPNNWHLVHLGSRAVGGAGLVMAEASAVVPEGRISPQDTGIWEDGHIEAWRPITAFIEAQGAVPAIQLAHAGRKAGSAAPWDGGKPLSDEDAGWPNFAPSPVPFSDAWRTPIELQHEDIRAVVKAFGMAAGRSLAAGFRIVEIHAAHGYLLHQFLSPLSNSRTDAYGGSFENRTRIVLEVAEEVRRFWPERLPLFIRISCSDWVEGGWDIEQSVELARILRPLGVDLVDCSSGGAVPRAVIPAEPGYQVPFADRIRREADVLTAAVGLITEPRQAETIIDEGKADLILLARESLRDPYWPRRAALEVGAEIVVPKQYARAW